MAEPVWVLCRARDGDDAVKVVGVFADLAGVEARIAQIAARNPQHPMRRSDPSVPRWRIGPDDDQGFFGHRPMRLWAVEAPFHTPEDPGAPDAG